MCSRKEAIRISRVSCLMPGCVLWSAILSFCGSGCVAAQPAPSEPPSYTFTNGRWFDGQGFREGTWHAVQGRLTRSKPEGQVEVVDLQGGYVIPPFAEAHNHNVEGPWNLEAAVRRYLADGVFYVKIPGNIAEFTRQIRPRVNRPDSIDVLFSNGGLTAAGGHPVPLYEEVLATARYAPVVGRVPSGWFNGRAYFAIDQPADLERVWPAVLADRPDFIKVYLAHSEEFSVRRAYSTPGYHSGLSPALLPPIVAKAHGDGLTVAVHVETADDFRAAVQARADEITHVPGWWIAEPDDMAAARLTERDAEMAAAAGVTVVTTTVAASLMPGQGSSPAQEGHHGHSTDGHGPHASSVDPALVRDLQRENLLLLHRHHVRLAVGSDHAETSLAEVLNLQSLGVFDNRALLKLWCQDTPLAIFPQRKIGRLEEGYEASFLVLAGDPTADFAQVRAIRARFKQGRPLAVPNP